MALTTMEMEPVFNDSMDWSYGVLGELESFSNKH